MKKTLTCVVATMLNPCDRILAQVLLGLIAPLRLTHAEFGDGQWTRRGGVVLLASWALGAWQEYLNSTARTLVTSSTLRQWGLGLGRASSEWAPHPV